MIDESVMILKVGSALTMLLFGIHQLAVPAEWHIYVPEWVPKTTRMSIGSIMRIHAIGNIAIALYLVSGITPLLSAWAALIWWVSILPFAFASDWKIAMRDLSVTFSILALVFLLS